MDEMMGVDGINVGYDVEGKGAAVLLIHGNGIGSPAWKDVARELAQSYAIYTVDLPGFGRSDMPDVPYSVPFYEELLNKLLHQLKLGPIIVAGVSMGGAVAATLAAHHPDKVSKLVLVAPAGLTPPQGEFVKPSWYMDAEFWLLAHNKERFQHALEGQFYDKDKLTPGLVDELWDSMKNPEHRRAVQRNARYLAKADISYHDLLSSISMPTLIVWGREDQIIPVSDAERFAGLIPHADVLTFGHCGHAVPVEKGEALADAMLSFLGEEVQYYESG